MWRIVVVFITILPLLGCGGRKQDVVSGKVTYKGQPVNGVMLLFYPIPDGQPIPIPVNQEGAFRTTGVAPGEYKVVVKPPETQNMPAMPKGSGDPAKNAEMKQKYQQAYPQQPPTIAYPDKYKDLVTTDLKCTISDSSQPFDLKLTD